VLAGTVLVAGCGGGGGSTPGPAAAGAAVTGFSRAFGAGDGAKACGLLTSAAQAAFVKRVQVLAPTSDCPTAIKRVHDAAGTQVTGALAAAKVSAVKVNGNAATATLTAAGHSTTVGLAMQDGAWKLTGVPGI
jgi:Tfp pilus assembly protein PilW